MDNYYVTIKAIVQATSLAAQLTYRAALGLGRGGRPQSLTVSGFFFDLLGGCPGPSVGCGPLPERKRSHAGRDSSTDAQYLVYNKGPNKAYCKKLTKSNNIKKVIRSWCV